MASDPKTQTKRESATASTTPSTAHTIDAGTASIPPIRSIVPRSERPIRMNTMASSVKTMMRQKEWPASRVWAEKITCWYQPITSPAVTVVITPDTWSASPAR
jgi:hypothetical protein